MITGEETGHGVAAAGGCQVTELGGGRYEVRMAGVLYAGWVGRLAAALAARLVNVVSLHGTRGAVHRWEAELIVEPLDRSVDARAIDYLGLAREGRAPAEASTANLVLDGFTLTRTGKELVVDVEGVDAVGFLDRILRVFAFYSLFPRELRVETRGPKVKDQFRLQGLGGTSPSLQVCEAVGLRLRELAGPPDQ
ncbi:MAG TPA: hypothetical protein VFP50_01705 [Anaeromyxobacteraceae bacterium]|nr:hypothetical protein [Anaeromyxobacteraceae bacterium]